MNHRDVIGPLRGDRGTVHKGKMRAAAQILLAPHVASGTLARNHLFASYHVSQGMHGTTAMLYGLVLDAAFCVLGRLWPVVVAHVLSNVVAVVLAD